MPPDDHLQNLAEKAIQTWKDNFIGVMSDTAETFPVHLWCQAIPQAERQLFLIGKSHVNPKVSEYAQVYGPHDYNTAPFVQIGMETLMRGKTKRWGAFADHCIKCYVLGTAFEHYRSWKMWMKETRATIISATVFHKHKYITNPSVTPEDRVMATAGKLPAELKVRMATHLRETALQQLGRIGTIPKQVWTHQ